MKSSDYEDADHHTRSSAMIPHRKMDMRSFFSTAKKRHHLANLAVQDYRDEIKANAEAQQRNMRQAEIEEIREANRTAARKRRNDVNISEIAEDLRTDAEKIQDDIDGLVEDADDVRLIEKKKHHLAN